MPLDYYIDSRTEAGYAVCGAFDPATGELLLEERVPLDAVAERMYGLEGATELAGELGYSPSALEGRRKRRRRRKQRRSKRKARRKKVFSKVKSGVKKAARAVKKVGKKIAKSRVVRGIGKLALAAASVIPGGQAVTAAYAAAKIAAKVAKRVKEKAKRGDPKAMIQDELIEATKSVGRRKTRRGMARLRAAKERARKAGLPTSGDVAKEVLKDVAGKLVIVEVSRGKGRKPAKFAYRRTPTGLVKV